jgi:hypothetical protein
VWRRKRKKKKKKRDKHGDDVEICGKQKSEMTVFGGSLKNSLQANAEETYLKNNNTKQNIQYFSVKKYSLDLT